jgi:predicted chitinase
MNFTISLSKWLDPNKGNWTTTLTDGYQNIRGKTISFNRYKDPDKIKDASGNPTEKDANNGYWEGTGELTGLIPAFKNPITQKEVTLEKIEGYFKANDPWEMRDGSKFYYESLAFGVCQDIEKKYKQEFGIDIKLAYTEIPEEKKDQAPKDQPTENKSAPSTGVVAKYVSTTVENSGVPVEIKYEIVKDNTPVYQTTNGKNFKYDAATKKITIAAADIFYDSTGKWDPKYAKDPFIAKDQILTLEGYPPGQSEPPGTEGPKIYGEFVFDVQEQETFFNKDFGKLIFVAKGALKAEEPEKPEEDEEITDPYATPEEDDEYTEEEFVGDEEFVAPAGEFIVIKVESANDIKGFDPEKPDESLSTDNYKKYPISKNVEGNVKKIIKVAQENGIKNKYAIAAMLAICKKECGLVPRSEASYSGTSAKRIKKIFSKFKKYSDDEVNSIKKNPEKFFDIIYGERYGNGKIAPKLTKADSSLGPEGYKYRGRGLNQITFKGNYQKYKDLSGHDIIADPDLLNTVEVAARCLVEYFKSNFKGASSDLKKRYNFTDINSFKSLDDATGAFYHANAGFGTSYSEIVADATGGRKKAFDYSGSLYNDYTKNLA